MAISELAEFAARLRLKNVDPKTSHQSKLVIPDTLGAILAGSDEKEITHLYHFCRQLSSKDEGTVFGRENRVAFLFAAMVNGAAGSTKEWDEGNPFVSGHPAIQIIPAAIAAGEMRGATGERILEGVLAGYEVGGRISLASKMRNGFHPSGTWGTIGAAVASGKIFDFNAENLLKTMNIAASFAITTNVENSFLGKNVSEMYAAMTNYFGIFSLLLKQFGFSAAEDNLEITFSRLVSESLSPEVLLNDLGRKFLMDENYFKMYPTCRFSHSALDALWLLIENDPPHPNKIQEVEVHTYKQGMYLNNQKPENIGAVRFSLPYLIAMGLLNKRIDEEAIGSFMEAQPILKTLAAKVRLIEEEDFNKKLPLKRPTRIKVLLDDGRYLESFVENCRGGRDSPYLEAELKKKFERLSEKVIGTKKVKRVKDGVCHLDQLKDIRELTQELRKDA